MHNQEVLPIPCPAPLSPLTWLWPWFQWCPPTCWDPPTRMAGSVLNCWDGPLSDTHSIHLKITKEVHLNSTKRPFQNIKLTKTGWWYTYPSETYESQLGLSYPIYMWKIKHVPNHQPETVHKILRAAIQSLHYFHLFPTHKYRLRKGTISSRSKSSSMDSFFPWCKRFKLPLQV